MSVYVMSAHAMKPPSTPQAEERVFLQPGAIHVTKTPALVTAIVGSGVAVCLWSPAAAGAAHFVLPRGRGRSPRFGSVALPLLLDSMIRRGARRIDIVAAVFGGANVLRRSADSALGQRNVDQAIAFLERYDIPVMRTDAGGTAARKLTFRTIDGSTIVQPLNRFRKTE